MDTISLFLMGKKGLDVLLALISSSSVNIIDKIILSKDRNVEKDYYNELKDLCIKHKISYYDRNDPFLITSKFCIAISWRWLINLYGRSQLIVLHDSILPRYRGYAPLVNMLINREPEVGVTAILANKEFDKGDIIMQRKISIKYPIKIGEAIDLITPLYIDIVSEILKKIHTKKCDELKLQFQNENDASYSLWRDEEDYRINWNDTAYNIMQFIYSLGFPYKGASTDCEGQILRIFDCEIYDDVTIENRTPGKILFIINQCPVVVCSEGLLKITQIYDEFGHNYLPMKKFRLKFK